MIRVGLDLQALQAHNASGYGYYVDGLYKALQAAQTNDIELVGLESQWKSDLPTVKRFYHDRFELPKLAKQAKVDLLHQPTFSCPKSSTKVIWTLHDVRSLILNESMSLPAAWYWKKWLPYSARYANTIICISDNTRRDAEKYLHIPKEKMTVIPVGVPQAILDWSFSDAKGKAVLDKFQIAGPFFSTVGTIQPIKNFPFLIDAFVALKKEFNLKHQLVIIGKKNWGYDAVAERLQKYGLTEGKEVVITDYVTDDEKWSLIKQSEAFLFPSLYEGFGIPPLEAQALGVPVVASNSSSLPDVVGEGALLCSPHKVAEWVKAYQDLPARRSILIQAGHENLKKFLWPTIAEQWLNLYRST